MTEPIGTVPKIPRRPDNEVMLAGALQVILRSLAMTRYVRKSVVARANQILEQADYSTVSDEGVYSAPYAKRKA